MSCTLFVDPCCPHAWTTSRWLAEVEALRRVRVTLGLVSLSVVNEGRKLEDWYRQFNDLAWAPARVAAAVHQRHAAEGLRRFYESFGELRHVQRRRDDEVVSDALKGAGLDVGFAAAASDSSLDEALHAWTRAALDPVHADVGTPVIHLGGEAFFGPVLTSVPRGPAAVSVFDAVVALSRVPAFVEYKRGRPG